MADWQHDNPWRQGHILSAESVKKLNLTHQKSSDDTVVLIISHDCDLAQLADIEPHCEIIAGIPIEHVNGDLANAKNVRRLHLTFSAGETKLAAEFIATDKALLTKAALAGHEPATKIRLTPDEHFTLQTWLAVRYRRAAFADEFDKRIKNKKTKFYEKFVKIIKATETNLIAVYFDVDAGAEVVRVGSDDTYTLAVYLVYNVAEDPAKAEPVAKSAAQALTDLFTKCFFVGGKWQDIELRLCREISEDAMTIFQSRLLRQWHFDYLSLREEPQGPMVVES